MAVAPGPLAGSSSRPVAVANPCPGASGFDAKPPSASGSVAWQAPVRYEAARTHVIGAALTSPRLHPPRNAPMFSSAEVYQSGANPLTFGEFWRARPFDTSTGKLTLRIVSPSPFIWARSEAPIITESPNVG